MSISAEITRITEAKDTIRAKLTELGLADETYKINALAAAVASIENRGAVAATVTEGKTYTIPRGYHNGSGTVMGLTDTAGEAEQYKTQTKTVTPTKAAQNVTPDSGYYALSSVTVNAIPAAYQDVTSVTATVADVLTGKAFVESDGTVAAGTMPNNGAIERGLSTSSTSYTIPKGYHNGEGVVAIELQEKSVTPTKSEQTVTPSLAKVLSKVTVGPIPDEYITTTDATAKAGAILAGETAYVNGVKIEGTMPNNEEAVLYSNEGFEFSSDIENYEAEIPHGFYVGAKIKTPLQNITVTPTKQTQDFRAGQETETGFIRQVIVNPIPDEYITTGDATATSGQILAGYTAYVNGAKATGTMPNNGTITKTLDTTTKSYTIPQGHHSGNGRVSITTETKTATPTKSEQTISATTGKVLSSVTVAPIPTEYITTTDANAESGDLLLGKTAYIKGVKVTGTMSDNGSATASFTGLTDETSFVVIPAGYTTGGTISLTKDIEDLLASI